ncbi:MAG: sugar phosphate isomerase/epimerase, partial [Thermicanus sp.]|nr:sugar phosphate isomerase/epimerase [Thermicanus sp.]
ASNDFATYDESLFKKGIDDIKRAVTLADRFGVKVVRIFAGDVKSGINYEQAKKRIVEGLKTVAEEAEKKKIFLGIENHGRLAGKSSQVKELIDTVGSDYIGSTFDMGNFILVGEDPIDAYKTLAKHVVHIHAKDFMKAPDNFEG